MNKNIISRLSRLRRKNFKIIAAILAIAATAAFGQFIIEEAIQNYGFGVSMLIMNKLYRNSVAKAEYVKEQLEYYQAFHNSCQTIMSLLYIGNPLTAIWFHQYMVSDQKKLDTYKKLVSEELYYLRTKQKKFSKHNTQRYILDKKHVDSIIKIK